MKAYDTVKKVELEVTYDSLVKLIDSGRQVDVILYESVTDGDGYLTWDVEHWSSTFPGKYIRTYTLRGRVLRDYTVHNIYDLKVDFHPENAKEIQIS